MKKTAKVFFGLICFIVVNAFAATDIIETSTTRTINIDQTPARLNLFYNEHQGVWHPGIIDPDSHAAVVSDLDHYLIHIGKSWVYSGTLTVNAAATQDFLIVNSSPTDSIHLKDFTFTSTQATAFVVLYGSPTITVNGTLQSLINKNRSLGLPAASGLIYLNPTNTALGTQLERFQISGSKQTGGTALGGGDEWILPPGYKILLRFTNNAAQADVISVSIKLLDIPTH